MSWGPLQNYNDNQSDSRQLIPNHIITLRWMKQKSIQVITFITLISGGYTFIKKINTPMYSDDYGFKIKKAKIVIFALHDICVFVYVCLYERAKKEGTFMHIAHAKIPNRQLSYTWYHYTTL